LGVPRIAVVGSYATGLSMRVEHLPSPGETVLAKGYRTDYGGKGSNQAVGCARLGASVSFVAKIGRDNFGDMALGLYRNEGIDVSYVTQTADAPTGVGFIMVEEKGGQNCISLDPGANELLTAAEVSNSDGAFTSAVVVIAQLEIPIGAAEAALRRGRAQGLATILNPAPVRPLPDSMLEMVDVLTPNQVEAKILVGRSSDDSAPPEDIGRELIRRGVKQVVMTLGEDGALVITKTSVWHLPAIQVTAVDATGAGDAFNAGLATALAFGEGLRDAAQFAVVAGGLAVRKEGVIPSLPYCQDLIGHCRRHNLTPPQWLSTS
jgi:ribokinase